MSIGILVMSKLFKGFALGNGFTRIRACACVPLCQLLVDSTTNSNPPTNIFDLPTAEFSVVRIAWEAHTFIQPSSYQDTTSCKFLRDIHWKVSYSNLINRNPSLMKYSPNFLLLAQKSYVVKKELSVATSRLLSHNIGSFPLRAHFIRVAV